MGLSWRQRFALRLRMRYKFKRIYLTLVIPAIIGMFIMSYALYVGFAPVPTLGPNQSAAAASSAALSKLEEFEELFPNATVNGQGQNLSSVHAATPPNPHNFDLVLVASLMVALAPFSVDATIKDRELRKHETDFTDFLFELSELVRGGIDPIKAITTLSQGSLGSITKQVQMVAKQMQIG